jgi:SAM-dependent methyltransferase
MLKDLTALGEEDLRSFLRLRDLATAYMQARVLHEACERSVFTELEKQPGTPDELARRLSLHPLSTRMLLEALAAMGLITVHQGAYRNTRAASRFLVETSPLDQTEIIALYRRCTEQWERLGMALHCGHVPPERSFDPRFIHAMHCTAVVLAPLVARRLDLSGVDRLLDLGGGPGTYSIFLALARPSLRAEVLDLEEVLPITQEYVELFGVADRVATRAGDYHSSDLGQGWDMVLLSNVLHSNDRARCRSLLARVSQAVRPGGRVVVNDFLRDEEGSGPLAAALFALHMLLHTPGGDTYRASEIRAWMEEAGLTGIEVLPLAGTTHSLVVGSRMG